jgi:hypothetical protein
MSLRILSIATKAKMFKILFEKYDNHPALETIISELEILANLKKEND